MTLIHGPVDPAEATAGEDAALDEGMKFIDTSDALRLEKNVSVGETVGAITK